jgi:hypothetical protein
MSQMMALPIARSVGGAGKQLRTVIGTVAPAESTPDAVQVAAVAAEVELAVLVHTMEPATVAPGAATDGTETAVVMSAGVATTESVAVSHADVLGAGAQTR